MSKRAQIISAIGLLLLLLSGGYCTYAIMWPLPVLKAREVSPLQLPAKAVSLPWPTTGQVAFGLKKGVAVTSGQQKKFPTASVAKVMTALAVLDKHPLSLGQNGPNITITSQDYAIYQNYVARNGSYLQVQIGEQLSEYQALQALMLPSANNIADTLANWAFGSPEAYKIYANQKAKQLGMNDSEFSDASGFSSTTVSTAHDLVLLGQTAMNSPILAEIAAQTSANFPIAGTVTNRNWLLGTDSVDGIKTGNTDEAGGCFLASVLVSVPGSNEKVRVVVAVMGATNLDSAIRAAQKIIEAAPNNFETITVPKNTVIANRNWLLGTDSVDGIKTGNTDEAVEYPICLNCTDGLRTIATKKQWHMPNIQEVAQLVEELRGNNGSRPSI